jgi:hypothetical protein
MRRLRLIWIPAVLCALLPLLHGSAHSRRGAAGAAGKRTAPRETVRLVPLTMHRPAALPGAGSGATASLREPRRNYSRAPGTAAGSLPPAVGLPSPPALPADEPLLPGAGPRAAPRSGWGWLADGAAARREAGRSRAQEEQRRSQQMLFEDDGGGGWSSPNRDLFSFPGGGE